MSDQECSQIFRIFPQIKYLPEGWKFLNFRKKKNKLQELNVSSTAGHVTHLRTFLSEETVVWPRPVGDKPRHHKN